MREKARILCAAGLAAFTLGAASAADLPGAPPASRGGPPLPIHAQGNRLVDDNGATVRLRGVMIPDPARLQAEGAFTKGLFEQIAAAGANVVRLPVHPKYWSEDPWYLRGYIEKAVQWAGECGMYIIVDWHSIGNVETGVAPLMPDLYCHTRAMTMDFWAKVAARLGGSPHVMFEIFNEPQGISAADWRRVADRIVQVIREAGARQLVIVGGVEYSRVLSWALRTPIADANIAYAEHIYPQHKQYLWEGLFGDVAARFPVLMTEWGFMDENRVEGDQLLAGSAESYGTPLLGYMDRLGIGWVACWYDDQWLPPMLAKGRAGNTRFGDFVMKELSAAR